MERWYAWGPANINPAGQVDANGNMVAIPGQSCYDATYNNNGITRVRYADLTTPTDPDQFSSSATNKETNWLPSLNLNYKLNEDTVIRFSASKTMARPKIDSLKPSFKFVETVFGSGDSFARISNPFLIPLESKNLDFAYEWYFNEGGALSVTLFNKDMSNFEEEATVSAHWSDLRGLSGDELSKLDPFTDILISKENGSTLRHAASQENGTNCIINRRHRWQNNDIAIQGDCDTINVTAVRNGQGVTNRGVEIGYNQNYDFLPGIFGGLGAAINYTYSDSDSETDAEDGPLNSKLAALPMANVSKHVYNISAFWEQDGNLIRLAYNYRTDSLARRGFESGALWNEGGGQLDISATYKYNENVSFTFNAVNLNNKESRQYYTNIQDKDFTIEGNALDGDANKSRTIRQWVSGTTYRLGVRADF